MMTTINCQRTIGKLLILPLLWICLWLSSSDKHGLPGGVLFALTTLFALALVFGKISQCLSLPPLLGMLLIGFVLRVLSDVTKSTIFVVDTTWSSSLRSIALVVILTRAGLGLDLINLRRLSWSVLRLACIPNLTEATVDAIMAVVLFKMPWLWAFMLGFILSAVSPAVVVPSLLYLKDEKYGTKKGIPDLVLAAASFDDVLSISGFGICLGLSLSDGSSLAWDILRAPAELLTGIVGGIVLGIGAKWITPSAIEETKDGEGTKGDGKDEKDGKDGKDGKEDSYVRTIILLLLGCFVLFGSKKIHFTGAGALAVIVMGLTYKHYTDSNAMDQQNTLLIKSHFKIIWVNVAQPFLFVLIGASVSVSYLDGEFVGTF